MCENERKDVNVVSLFDGISCGMTAFIQAKMNVNKYYAFEIDKYAKAISRYRYPDIIQCGDVLDADFNQFKNEKIEFVIGGSPCTFWSIAKKNREVDKSGIGWKLFMGFVNAVKIIQPHYFLYENVASMPKTIKDFITEEFQCEPIMINSALVSAQHRKRLYWTNIKGISQPDNNGILLKDILDSGITSRDKSLCIDASYYKGTSLNSPTRKGPRRTVVYESTELKSVGAGLRTREDETGKFKRLEVRKDDKLNALTTVLTDSMVCQAVPLGIIGNGGQGERVYSVCGKTVCISANGGGRGAKTGLYKVDLPDGDYIIRKLIPIEAERCQTLPDQYTALGIDDKGKTVPISNTQRYKCIGNGWTVKVISHILSCTHEIISSNAEPNGSFFIEKTD